MTSGDVTATSFADPTGLGGFPRTPILFDFVFPTSTPLVRSSCCPASAQAYPLASSSKDHHRATTSTRSGRFAITALYPSDSPHIRLFGNSYSSHRAAAQRRAASIGVTHHVTRRAGRQRMACRRERVRGPPPSITLVWVCPLGFAFAGADTSSHAVIASNRLELDARDEWHLLLGRPEQICEASSALRAHRSLCERARERIGCVAHPRLHRRLQ